MFGIRTPVKTKVTEASDPKTSSVQTEQAGPSHKAADIAETSKVRRSIGEWESGNPESLPPKTPPKKAAIPAPTKPKLKTVSAQESKQTAKRLSVDTAKSPSKPEKTKYANRTTEARACLTKAKTYLSNSRNLRTDIKQEVTQAIERLFELVKEAEAENSHGRSKNPEKEIESEPDVDQITKEVTRSEESDLKKTIDEHSKLIKDNNEKMESLKIALENQREILEKTTYASVAAGQPRTPPGGQAALHSVVVSSKNETDTGEEILNRIREVVKAKEGGIKVDRVRKAKDRKVIVGCRTEEERQKVKERLRKAESHLNVEEVKNKDPLLILRDVLEYNSDEEVLNALKNQNGNIYHGLDKEDDRAEVRYRKKTRNPYTCHIVLRVSPRIWNRMTDAGEVHIDLQRIKVADQTPLVQCSRCLGYGHGRRFCKETVEKCCHCGGPHMKAECADWLAGAAPSCCNCRHAKLDEQEHNAFSPQCAVRRRWDALARATVAYC